MPAHSGPRSVLAPVGPLNDGLATDGRQSDRAMAVRRGMSRHLRALGMVALPEVVLKSGRRPDLMALAPDGAFWIIEIKSSVADFRADHKWPEYRAFSDRFAFATLDDVPTDIFPQDAGLFIADAYGAACLREPTLDPLAAARRKSLLITFARHAAGRLQAIEDPQLGENTVW
jgi:hypothetical protein